MVIGIIIFIGTFFLFNTAAMHDHNQILDVQRQGYVYYNRFFDGVDYDNKDIGLIVTIQDFFKINLSDVKKVVIILTKYLLDGHGKMFSEFLSLIASCRSINGLHICITDNTIEKNVIASIGYAIEKMPWLESFYLQVDHHKIDHREYLIILEKLTCCKHMKILSLAFQNAQGLGKVQLNQLAQVLDCMPHLIFLELSMPSLLLQKDSVHRHFLEVLFRIKACRNLQHITIGLPFSLAETNVLQCLVESLEHVLSTTSLSIDFSYTYIDNDAIEWLAHYLKNKSGQIKFLKLLLSQTNTGYHVLLDAIKKMDQLTYLKVVIADRIEHYSHFHRLEQNAIQRKKTIHQTLRLCQLYRTDIIKEIIEF